MRPSASGSLTISNEWSYADMPTFLEIHLNGISILVMLKDLLFCTILFTAFIFLKAELFKRFSIRISLRESPITWLINKAILIILLVVLLYISFSVRPEVMEVPYIGPKIQFI